MEEEVLCRLCASEGNAAADMILLYDESMECISLRQKIEKHTPIKLDGKLSRHVCTTCSDLVHKWDTFCQQCEKAEMILLARLPSQFTEKETETNQSVQQTEVQTEVEQKRTKSRYSYCVAKWCNSNNTNCPNMFRLPQGWRGREWLERADRKDLLHLQPHQLTRRCLCSKHFTKDCFIRPNKLTWNAVPTIFKTHRLVTKTSCNSSVTSLQGRENSGVLLKEKWRPVLPAPKKIDSAVAADYECANICSVNGISESTTVETSSGELQARLAQPESTTSVECISVVDIINAYSNNSLTPVTLTLEPCGIQNSVDQITNALMTTGVQLQSTDSVDSSSFFNSLVEECTEKCDEILYSTVKETKQMHLPIIEPTQTKDSVNCLLSQDASENSIVKLVGSLASSENNEMKEKHNKEGFEILNELESLYSEQSFQESVLPCSACGEVFLMKSSLLHHQKRYHTEHFEASGYVNDCSE